jgi:hypothetical protein
MNMGKADMVKAIQKVLWQAHDADDETVNPQDWDTAMEALAKLKFDLGYED